LYDILLFWKDNVKIILDMKYLVFYPGGALYDEALLKFVQDHTDNKNVNDLRKLRKLIGQLKDNHFISLAINDFGERGDFTNILIDTITSLIRQEGKDISIFGDEQRESKEDMIEFCFDQENPLLGCLNLKRHAFEKTNNKELVTAFANFIDKIYKNNNDYIIFSIDNCENKEFFAKALINALFSIINLPKKKATLRKKK